MTTLLQDIRAKVSAYLERTGMAEEDFGRQALGRPDFVQRLGVQRTMTLKTADRLLRFMGEAPIGPVFRREVEAFLEVTGTEAARTGIDAVGDSRFVNNLRAGDTASLNAVEQVRAWMGHAATPSQSVAIARMLEDSSRSASIVSASPAMRGESRKGGAFRASVADGDAENPPEHRRRTFLTTREAATVLSVAPRTLIRYRATGVGPAYFRFHGKVAYTRADLLRWAYARRESTRESD